MKVLVTGGTGFIGSHLVAALLGRGDSVRVLRRANSSLIALEELPAASPHQEIEHVIGDILEPEAVARAVVGCDLVYHVAALSSYWRAQRAQVYRVNVEGTRVVMEACLRARVPRVVHTSSAAAVGIPKGWATTRDCPYGGNGQPADKVTAYGEQMPFDRLSATFAYADSKHRAEGEVYRAIERGLQAVIVNPVAVIGPGDHYLISSSMIVEFARRPIPAVPPGGLCVADIDAIVQGHLAAAERGRVGERYILGGENLTHFQLAAIICEIVGQPAPRLTIPAWALGPVASIVDAYNRVNPRPPAVSGEQLRLGAFKVFYDSSKAVAELGYPMLPFRPAAERAYRWYREHGYIT